MYHNSLASQSSHPYSNLNLYKLSEAGLLLFLLLIDEKEKRKKWEEKTVTTIYE
jgi:hypothetical protein